jgi:hypothetical protein
MGDGKEPEDDEVIRKRSFDMGGGLDLSGFLDADAVNEANEERQVRAALPEPSSDSEVEDVAMGDMFDPFATGPQPGEVERDGSVRLPSDMDSVTEIATTGEKRLHWGIMVGMIVVYSLVGWLIGTTLDPVVGLFGLLGLALLGFYLGELWVPDPAMRMLGITWVIITMKLLYGLAIDLHQWELWGVFPIDATQLGGLLLMLVGLNVFVAYHHDEDAIAAQATLVLLAIGSGAGAVYGQLGVAGGIIVATLLLHGLAIHRKSGNLAALGIAFSNIWIGLHAFSSGWSIGALEIVSFDDPLLLFLLLGGINAVNAAIAAHFARSENWFSQALSLVGLGKPGLWSVSIGLGMGGALLAIAAHRAETSYSLGLITMLLASFGGSYLVVRGVEPKRVVTPLASGLVPIIFILILMESGLFGVPFGLTGYDVFTVTASILTAGVLLSNQEVVSDHVLWGGSLAIMLLMTILIPAQPSSQGGDGALLLFAMMALMHIGTGALALKRESPSLAGVTILAPWLWVLVITIWSAGARTFNATNQEWELASGVIGWDGWVLVSYLCVVTLLQYPVNRALGDSGVNLAARLVGLSEVGARLRDSGMMQLWNLGFILSLLVWVSASRPGEMPGLGLLLGLAVLMAVHIFAECRGEHQNNPRTLLVLFGITAAWMQWRYDLDAAWMILTVASLGSLVIFDERIEVEDVLTLLMGFLTVQILLSSLDQNAESLLNGAELLTPSATGWVALACVALSLGLYLPRAGTMEKLLKPAASSVVMLVVTIWAFLGEDSTVIQLMVAAALFVGSGIWLAAQGELRSELKAVGKRDERAERYAKIAAIQQGLETIGVQPKGLATPSGSTAGGGAASAIASGTATGILEAATAAGIESGDSTTPTAASSHPLTDERPVVAQDPSTPQKTYHFLDSDLASAAADASPEMVEATSQAVSVGQMKTLSPELLTQAARMRKKSKRRGELSNEEVLYGDIHHKPVIVLTFIVGIIIFGLWSAWNIGSAAAGILVISGFICLILIGISRWRASANDLTLPDILGLETPFAATMVGLTLLHMVGRLAPGSMVGNQLDFAVLCVMLVVLGGISLVGRKDLVHRIPSIIEWLIACLMIARFSGAVLAGSMPLPVLTDPLTLPRGGSLLTYTIPWLAVEGVILAAVLGWDWIEGVRRKNSLPDFHGAAGRGGWVMVITMLSLGPAAVVAIALGLRRAYQWKQPAAVSIDIIAVVIAWVAFSSWIDGMLEWLPELMMVLGLISLVAMAATVPMRAPRWTTAWAWDAHLLLFLGVLLMYGYISPLLVVSLFALSLTVWVAGILQLRRSLRFWGAADLVVGLVCAALAAQGVLDTTTLLMILIALGFELGIITWLGQKHEGQMAVD